MIDKQRVFLIGGSSHSGKSTLAESLASQLGWKYQSTDKLARHPGRPWQEKPKKVPEHVAEHYLFLSVEELIADVHRHYRDNVWPLIQELVDFHATGESSDKLIMEGSALLPALIAKKGFENTAAIWLTASNDLFERRMYAESKYQSKSPGEKELIDKFLARTQLYNERMMADVKRLDLVSIDVEKASSINDLAEICLTALKNQ